MNVTIEDVLYTRIGKTNTACVGTEDGSKNAVSDTKEGEVRILPYVPINGNVFKVTTVGKCAFYRCTKVTNIIIPNTVKLLKYYAFKGLSLKKTLILPSSIKTVEPNFIDDWYSQDIVFCGLKEPEKISTSSSSYWLSVYIKRSIIVPLEYRNEEFCKKGINKTAETGCPVIERTKRNTCYVKRSSSKAIFNLIIIITS